VAGVRRRQARRQPAVPFSNQIENPDPVSGTNNYYTQDGYRGGSYVNCSAPAIGDLMNLFTFDHDDRDTSSHTTSSRNAD
jgi:hypothetical protein